MSAGGSRSDGTSWDASRHISAVIGIGRVKLGGLAHSGALTCGGAGRGSE